MQNYIGKQIDRYRIIERLGMGGMAVVYKAYDVRLEREVALKLIRTEAIPQEQHERLMKRFEREAKAQARFSHPNIVPVHDYGEVDGSPYIVMDYVAGDSLKKHLTGPVAAGQAIAWLLPIADALAYAHRRGVIHRDVKPSNILFDDEGRPMLTDFGIAKILETDEATLTGTGLGVGTPEYMAPEQWQGKATEATDQYALGVVLYELLTGQKPYTADTPAAVAIQQATEPLKPPSEKVDGIPEALEKVLYKALAKDTANRYADMLAFGQALSALTLTAQQTPAPELPTAQKTTRDKSALSSEASTRDLLEISNSSSKDFQNGKTPRKKSSVLIWLIGFFILLMGVVLGVRLWPNGGGDVEEVADRITETPIFQEEMETQKTDVEEIVNVENSDPIRIWTDEQRSLVLNGLADDFLAEYGVELIFENISGVRDQFAVAAPAGEGPDIIIVPHDQAAALVASGLVAPIDLGDKASDFAPEALEAFTYSGELFGMPYASENLGFFYYADYVEEPPTTWQGVYDMSKELINAGTVEYGIVLAGTSYDAYPWMTSQGGYIFGLDENGDYDPTDVGVGSEGMIQFGEMAKQWADDGILSTNTDNTTAKAMFLNGEVAFFMNGPWELNNLRQAGVNYDIAKFPDGGVPFLGVQGFLINAFSENILLAQAFLTEYVATEETMLAFVENDPRVPAYLPALDQLDDPDLLAIAEAGEGAQPMPAIPEMGKVWGDWGNALSFILNGEKTPEEAYTFAQDAIIAAIGSDTTGMVNLPGSWQTTVSDCEWDPACEATVMQMGDDGLYYATFTIPAGDYEIKVALNGGWDINYGLDGVAGGDNIPFTVETEGEVTFIYDPVNRLLEIIEE